MFINAVTAIPDLTLVASAPSFTRGLVFPSKALPEADTNFLALVAANVLDQHIVFALTSFFPVAFTTFPVLELCELVIIIVLSVTTEIACVV